MTLIVGYIYRDSVHIVADSAITYTNVENLSDLIGDYTTFGEIHIKNGNYGVGESAQKIFNLDNKLLIAFSGSTMEGIHVISDIALELRHRHDDKLTTIIMNYFKSCMPKSTQFIVGFYEDNKPVLIDFNNSTCEVVPEIYACTICGSGFQIFKDVIGEIVSRIRNENKLLKQQAIVLTIAIAQSRSLNVQTFENGVGGFFNGAYVDSNGVNWADDTLYFMLSARMEKGARFFVAKYNRDNFTYIGSTVNNQVNKLMTCDLSSVSPEELTKKWSQELHLTMRRLDAEYYIFICYDRPYVTIVSKANVQMKDMLIIKANDEVTLGINDTLKSLIYGIVDGKNINDDAVFTLFW